MAGAVMAGCLVATVKCSHCTTTKLVASFRPAAMPVQNGGKPRASIRNFTKVVTAITAPPPAALRSISRYSPRVRVMSCSPVSALRSATLRASIDSAG